MNRLTLLRHAKSSWDHPDLKDIQRPLNERGRHDAPLMGTECSGRISPPDLVLLSPAVRVRETIDLFLGAWQDADPRIAVRDELYQAGIPEWLELLAGVGTGVDHVLACGHQPGIGDLAVWLCGEFAEKFPTSAAVSIILGDTAVGPKSGRVDFFGCPRDFA